MNSTLRILRAGITRIGDALSDLTGYAAVRVPLQEASRPGEVTLDFTGYRQIDSYSCGGIAAAMAVKFLRPLMSFERIHSAVDPLPETGAGTTRIIRALRSLRIGATWRSDLTFDAICDAIDADRPVIVCVKTSDRDMDHWVVIYGYGRRPNLVFVAGQGLHFIARQRVKWPEFRRQWSLPGGGMLCWKAKHRKRRPPRRTVKKK